MSQYEYKVGDRVRVVKDDEDRTLNGKCGMIVSVDVDDKFYPFVVLHDGGDRLWHGPHEIEPEYPAAAHVVKQLDSDEVRTISSTGAEKGTKTERHDLIPAQALATVARHYGLGASKYDDHNWRRGYEWSKSYAALQRHANAFWAGENDDPESGSPHMAAVAFHALTLLTYVDEQPDFDDRWSGKVSA